MGNFTYDEARGFDVIRGREVVAHFDTYAEAWDYARAHHLTLRCWEQR